MTWAVRLANRDYRADQIARELARTPSGKRPAASKKYQRILETKGPQEATKYAVRTAEKAVLTAYFVASCGPLVSRIRWYFFDAAGRLPEGVLASSRAIWSAR